MDNSSESLSADTIEQWLIGHNGHGADARTLFSDVCERLLAADVAIMRASTGLPALNPQAFTFNLRWARGACTEEIVRAHGIESTAGYLNSPVAELHKGAPVVRRRLDIAEPVMDFPILEELREAGVTDYLALPLKFTEGRSSFVGWGTDRPGGFTERDIALLRGIMPALALRFEVLATRRMARDVLNTYLGRDAADRVLAGAVRRGTGTGIRAAIWSSDLRGFTAMADGMSIHDLVTTLDDYFECMARPVQDHGGEILKFVGDGMLAIFRCEPDDATACNRALDAAFDAFARLHELNQGRAIGGGVPLRTGIALHVGEVIYGNIGATDRLDFTVIGTAVNEVARTESMCAPLGRPLLATAAFAAHDRRQAMESVGFHVLRGMSAPRELFAAPPHMISGES